VNANTGWGFANNKLYGTTNSGQNWVNIFTATNSGAFFKIFFLNDSVGFLSDPAMPQNISKTTNGGFNWTGFANPDGYSNMYFLNENYAWLGSQLHKIKVIRNNGSILGWQYVPNLSDRSFSFLDTIRGWSGESGIIHTTDGGGPITDVGNNTQLTVKDYKLYQNYPNPFNPVTTIKFDLKKNANVTIKVFDIRGREVSTPLNGYYTAGEYELRFDGSKLTSGVYFYQLAINGEPLTIKKMLMIK
jgi:Secretion system C-terminal sorting domain